MLTCPCTFGALGALGGFGGMAGEPGTGALGGAGGTGEPGCAPESALPNNRAPTITDGRTVVNSLFMTDSSNQSAIWRERFRDAFPVGVVPARHIGIHNERAHIFIDVGVLGCVVRPR